MNEFKLRGIILNNIKKIILKLDLNKWQQYCNYSSCGGNEKGDQLKQLNVPLGIFIGGNKNNFYF
ncbi:hypothetical protein I4U23_021901 [Adineta vaga]|nr:hypothetical protein I4U23_021901 [Adineta vaga]